MEYSDYIRALGEQERDLARELASFHTLENVLAWMRTRDLPLDELDVVFQDEYSHDVLIPLRADGRYLVFGIT